ncbi:hypothetical protein B9Z19DRAFT_433452 [Tuber borchii]|uniref:Uncharacterized protein n=1 Tax=Tuber borchii TaxID=42251 RepID=A0A2T6ZGA0_TUBBO|nr:hypothetical protein B9Z19DRAFT_433452 [Tuber borchii]
MLIIVNQVEKQRQARARNPNERVQSFITSKMPFSTKCARRITYRTCAHKFLLPTLHTGTVLWEYLTPHISSEKPRTKRTNRIPQPVGLLLLNFSTIPTHPFIPPQKKKKKKKIICHETKIKKQRQKEKKGNIRPRTSKTLPVINRLFPRPTNLNSSAQDRYSNRKMKKKIEKANHKPIMGGERGVGGFLIYLVHCIGI